MSGGATSGRTPAALALEHVTHRFGATAALRDATLTVSRGSLQALLGENGAGKSTLLHIAFGHLRPHGGRVAVDGRARAFASPADAIAAGLGMVHQHFRLVPGMTVAENVALGRGGGWLDLRRVSREVARIGDETGLRIDPTATVATLGVAAQQRVEIVKALVGGARVLILDEPTAVLAPAEAAELLAWVRRYVDAGNAAVLITHKLREALAVADGVTVLRNGETVLAATAAEMDEASLVAAMMGDGRGALQPTADEAAELGAADALRGAGPPGGQSGAPALAARRQDRSREIRTSSASPVLVLRDVAYRDARGVARLREVSLQVHAGEVLGVAGIEGAGHYELLRLLAGRLAPVSGERQIPASVGFVPEDRHGDALALQQPLTENVLLRDAGRRRGLIDWRGEAARTRGIVRDFDVRGGAAHANAGALSGGNQQKLVLGRELWGGPAALVVESPTRGLDVRAGAAILQRLRDARDRGTAVVVYTSDLDELLSVADRVVVAHAGTVREVAQTREAIGRAMVGAG